MNRFHIFQFKSGSYQATGISAPTLEQAIKACEETHPTNLPFYVFEMKTKTENGKPTTTRF